MANSARWLIRDKIRRSRSSISRRRVWTASRVASGLGMARYSGWVNQSQLRVSKSGTRSAETKEKNRAAIESTTAQMLTNLQFEICNGLLFRRQQRMVGRKAVVPFVVDALVV